jgi:omega-6 fatty acid desaturase (delta-12 desaturase)
MYRLNVYMTSLVIAGLTGVLIWLVGLEAFLLIQLPVTMISSSAGTWLFFVQHQFEDAYWVNNDNWDYTNAALSGSSFYKLPKVLQWFTGNIGYHHIHHLSPRIPNYMLEQCHSENPEFQNDAAVLTLRKSLKSILLGLWDENQKKLVSFRQYKRVYMKMGRASV